MDKTFQPKAIEQALYQAWEEKGYFKPSNQGLAYSIPLPPPNVTGSLHMGHGFQDVLMDILSRYHRMMGDNTLWQPGTDHAGIATQIVVERQLQKENKTRYDLGRDAFIDKVWQWKDESGGNILRQMRRLGASCDWDRTHFSMDESLTQATLKAFVDLYREDLIYRGSRLVNWDIQLGTALSDLEVVSEEENGSLWHIRYPIAHTDESIVIATTRPETLLGDTAVAIHPEDERYQHLIGQHIALPLTDRTIPIIADDYVDPEFGTGCVKITPAHDFNDYEMGKRHDLPMINILNKDGTLNSNVPQAYQGLDRLKARKQIVQDLEQNGSLAKVEPHKLKVPRSERTGEIIEPFLSDQWYIKIKPLAEPAVQAAKEGKIRFIPENSANLYYRWMEDIQDWCISRQLWWGHRIPAWFDDENNVYVGLDEQDVRDHYQLDASVSLTQDEDVLDTWFTAALWPFSSLGWPEKTPELSTFYPHAVLVTGFDIIFFWVARMIMFGLKFMGDVPFKDVYIHGLIRDHEGQKMSKSKGNVLDPIDLIDGVDVDTLIQKRTYGLMNPKQAEKVTKATRKDFPDGIAAYGCDALRFTYTALASTSRDINFSVDRLEGYRNFCNKLWNAARFVTIQIDKVGFETNASRHYSDIDLWIRNRLNQAVNHAHRHIQQYRFDLLAQTLYEFIWHDYCDWYVELAKVSLQEGTPAQQQGALHTLIEVLETILRLAHPVIPFITESIWQAFRPYHQRPADSLMLERYPQVTDSEATELTEEVSWLQQLIVATRTLRSEVNLSPAKTINLVFKNTPDEQRAIVEKYQAWFAYLTKVEHIDYATLETELPATATKLLGKLEIHLPLAGVIDLEAEQERLQKELQKLDKEIGKYQNQLGNSRFVDNAPAEVVDKTRQQLESAQEKQSVLMQQLAKLQR